jgi:hypothetical protein
MHPEVIEKAMYSSSEKATKIVVEMGFIAYLESPSRDFEHYECGTLTAFMQRYFARKIDNACTMELSRLSMIRIVSGGTILSGEELVTQRKLIESLLSERLENYLRSTTFKFYQWVARI